MSLETHISGSEDRLIDGLHFGGKNTASYITARPATTFSPSSVAAWSPSGVRLRRFNLADHGGWLDGATLRLCFTLTNLALTTLDPIAVTPACLFRRVRIIANGSAVIEDIDNYARVYQLMSELLPCQRRMNDTAEAWGGQQLQPHLHGPIYRRPDPSRLQSAGLHPAHVQLSEPRQNDSTQHASTHHRTGSR